MNGQGYKGIRRPGTAFTFRSSWLTQELHLRGNPFNSELTYMNG